MRVLRAKQIRKYLKFYKIVYNINSPYHVILDGNFIYNSLKYKLDIKERLNKLLQGEQVTVYITRSSLNELNNVGEKAQSSYEFGLQCCTIIEDLEMSGETPAEKLTSYLESLHSNSNKKNFLVASQDKDLRLSISRKIPGVPLIYLNQVTLVLEPPSSKSKKAQIQIENTKTTVNEQEKEILNQIRIHEREQNTPEPVKVERKKRKATAPNPLSSLRPQEDSHTSKKKKLEKFTRRRG